jgi:hypothetical protein
MLVAGCGRVAEGTKQVLNKSGEIAGAAATEVVEGVASGVEKTWAVDVVLSGPLQARGLSLGRSVVQPDNEGRRNRVMVYLGADAAFRDTVVAFAFDQEGRELGRAPLLVDAPAHSGNYYEVRFASLTDLERKCRVELR